MPCTRREFLWRAGSGVGGVALAAMLSRESQAADALALRLPHFPAKATRVIEIFCPGGLSHVDTWDYKPELEKAHGQEFDAELGKQTFGGVGGKYAKSFWPFRQHGQCGRWMSDLFPKLAVHVDDMAFIHSMQSKSALHGPAMFMMNSGFLLPGFPSMGAWVTYGLGSENADLPAFVVLPDPRGLPPGGVVNWGAGFLPAVHQGTVIETAAGKAPIADLFPAQPRGADTEREGRDFLQKLNAAHASARSGDTMLEARIASYELAARLQLSAPDAVDIARESEATRALYALGDESAGPFGRQCLLARRLVERGVRFVQLYSGTGSKWDAHSKIEQNHADLCRATDKPIAGLLKDLKARGLLDSTLVVWGGEFGRTPMSEKGDGRDHNPTGFTMWMAGGGVKGGQVIGETDELGLYAVKDRLHVHDLHATILYLLGLDHTKLIYRHQGRPERLTLNEGDPYTKIAS